MGTGGALPIGLVAKFYGISHDTLRLYDKKGLLKPLVDPQTGYRSYSFEHLALLDMILVGRRLEVPLARLQQVFATQDLAAHEALLRDQLSLVHDRIEDLRRVESYLAEMLPVVEAAREHPNGYSFTLKEPLYLAEVLVEDVLTGGSLPAGVATQKEFLRFEPAGEHAFHED